MINPAHWAQESGNSITPAVKEIVPHPKRHISKSYLPLVKGPPVERHSICIGQRTTISFDATGDRADWFVPGIMDWVLAAATAVGTHPGWLVSCNCYRRLFRCFGGQCICKSISSLSNGHFKTVPPVCFGEKTFVELSWIPLIMKLCGRPASEKGVPGWMVIPASMVWRSEKNQQDADKELP
ncbi:MAG: hypothetical protein IPI30_21615 [Saprospiraceae bacterium]|nr:hypothetical protein [Candidatus Vicinibacter affinis]